MDAKPSNKPLSPRDVAERLNISRSGANNLLRYGQIPGAFRVGTLHRCPPEALDAYIARQQEAAK